MLLGLSALTLSWTFKNRLWTRTRAWMLSLSKTKELKICQEDIFAFQDWCHVKQISSLARATEINLREGVSAFLNFVIDLISLYL